ncbi:hypothetical protein BDK51DRAFT_49393 [Blyttiomyces helicus]|uniref:Uncharacterized protein n=1 Tax=Blyttiomyces helicus TaxID=388810 RepID=A0A4P9VZD0_9FUNG|nr:hypothetical protein BDK51DRAFT_49393 [Blyttiomyces helicus]|eukprot:RKO84143.1 hypothetical protein BDK51DRAFT_49393 [Blyttiomyces helicus]
MAHEAVWFSRPRSYGKGSRSWKSGCLVDHRVNVVVEPGDIRALATERPTPNLPPLLWPVACYTPCGRLKPRSSRPFAHSGMLFSFRGRPGRIACVGKRLAAGLGPLPHPRHLFEPAHPLGWWLAAWMERLSWTSGREGVEVSGDVAGRGRLCLSTCNGRLRREPPADPVRN